MKKKITILLALLLVGLLGSPETVNAKGKESDSQSMLFQNSVNFAPTKLGGRLQRGVKKMYYTINGTATNYSTGIKAAANNWVWTGYDNPVYLNLVTSTYATDLDFYATYKNNNEIGVTYFYNSAGRDVSPIYSNWYFAEVYMNTKYGSASYFQGTVRHEIGHALGLGHTTDQLSIMCQMGAGRKVQSVTKSDSDMIVSIYGWR